jgi:hypothetical protein
LVAGTYVFIFFAFCLHLLGLAGDLKKAMKDGKPIIIEVSCCAHASPEDEKPSLLVAL